MESVEIKACGAVHAFPSERWQELLTRIGNARSSPFVGWNGEAWRSFETIKIQWASRGRYALEFATRPSLQGKVLFNLQKREASGFSSYGHYGGDELRNWLLQVTHLSNCGGPAATMFLDPSVNDVEPWTQTSG